MHPIQSKREECELAKRRMKVQAHELNAMVETYKIENSCPIDHDLDIDQMEFVPVPARGI